MVTLIHFKIRKIINRTIGLLPSATLLVILPTPLIPLRILLTPSGTGPTTPVHTAHATSANRPITSINLALLVEPILIRTPHTLLGTVLLVKIVRRVKRTSALRANENRIGQFFPNACEPSPQ